MGLFDCVASPEERDQFDERERPITRPRNFSRSDHDISKRRALPLFSSQTSLKNVRDVDFWKKRALRFLFSPEGREDIRILRIPFHQLGYGAVTDFISDIPADLFNEYLSESPPDEGILKDDKIFWIRDGIAEPGMFKWQGVIENEPCIGLQLDRKKGVPFGLHDGKGLFYCKPGHRALVPEHEVMPYKKFLRNFLGKPLRKDSYGLRDSVRLNEKAIAAKNSKPGDRVYLPKEKKYAHVQWIGKIGNETVVDLIYEKPKPESGKPVSPDEPCFSRSLSMADFIDEVGASEPNTPAPVQPQLDHPPRPLVAENKQLSPAHVVPPPPPPPLSASEEESDDSENSTDDDDGDDDDDSEDNEENDESDQNSKSEPEPLHSEGSSVEDLLSNKSDSPKFAEGPTNIVLGATQDDPEAPPSPPELSPRLPSPKRKGFFGFSPKKKRARSPIRKVETKFDISAPSEHSEPEPEPEILEPPKRPKSPRFFSNFKFRTGNKKNKGKFVEPQLEPQEEPHADPQVEPEAIEIIQPVSISPPKKKKSDWGRLFKSRSKNTTLEKTEGSLSYLECTTPIDDMIPPEKIPTPPPFPVQEEYSERRIERPSFINIPDKEPEQTSNIPTVAPENLRAEVSLSPEQSSDSESSESEEELEDTPKHVATTVETHEAFDDNANTNTSVGLDLTAEPEGVSSPEPCLEEIDEPQTVSPSEVPSPPPRTPPSPEHKKSMEQFTDDKTRSSRPSSFGSFLARIKNQRRKPDGSLQLETPKAPKTKSTHGRDTSPEPEPEVQRFPDSSEIQDTPIGKGYKTLSESDTSLSSHEVVAPQIQSPKFTMEINKSLVKPVRGIKAVEGNQEGITLDYLEVAEPLSAVNSPTASSETPKRKNSRGKSSFSFNFTKKRKTSPPPPPPPPATVITLLQAQMVSSEPHSNEEMNENEENIEPPPHEEPPVKLRDKSTDGKQSKSNSFRDSFKRTFSLTRKKPTTKEDSDIDTPKSPPSTIIKPRPMTVYIDNNEAIKQQGSFRSKRPASVVVDIQPWNSRRGEQVDVYKSSSDEASPSPGPSKSPNPALFPKQTQSEVPKHRMFTTPSFFTRKKKPAEDAPKAPQVSNYTKFNVLESKSQQPLETPPSPPFVENTPSNEQSSPLSPSSPPPPPLPAAPPPPLKHVPSFTMTDGTLSHEQKLKSALKQRKEIDSIPRGLKVNDRVLWYCASGAIPGTVQRLFKDGTDKYTAMVKFDREITDEPLRLIREGDAYIITVEELITPDMFEPVYANQEQILKASPPPSQSPTTPSVRFDAVSPSHEAEVPRVEIEELDDDHDLPPPFQESEVGVACGFRRGIQCLDKSCCLETILFALFYTTNAFDIAILYGNAPHEDALCRNVRRILRKEIVDPLRRAGLCLSPAVSKLRDAVKPLSDEWQTLSTDAEVMMFILFDRALKLGKFISYTNSITDYLHQLVVDAKDLSKSTTVQHLFETSLRLMDNVKLKTMPTPALVLEMPRSKDRLMQYKAVIPNLTLHISHLIDDGSRHCMCGMVAQYECRQCTSTFGIGSIAFCDNCKVSADAIHFQLTHDTDLIPLNQPMVILDLVGIICVKAGHYFSFVKCGQDKLSPWVFFDGQDTDTPKVCIEQNLGMWLDRLEKHPGKYHDALQYPLLSHILQDSHICIYQPREKSSSV